MLLVFGLHVLSDSSSVDSEALSQQRDHHTPDAAGLLWCVVLRDEHAGAVDGRLKSPTICWLLVDALAAVSDAVTIDESVTAASVRQGCAPHVGKCCYLLLAR